MKTITIDQFGSTRKAIGGLAVALFLSWIPVTANAATVGYWRFESGNLLTDSSSNGLNLSVNSGTSGGAINYTLPPATSTLGAYFPTVIPQTGAANGSAAIGAGGTAAPSWGDKSFYTADSSVLAPGSGITVEALINLRAVNGTNRTLMGQGVNNATSAAWGVTVMAPDNVSRGSNDLIFQYQSGAAWGTGLQTIDSGILLTANHDYYIGIAINFMDASLGGAIFYVQDLTAGTAMQIVNKTHTAVLMNNATSPLYIGSGDAGSANWSGLIDEVRISDTQLSVNQLLMVPEPKAWALCLLAAAMLVIARRRHAVLNI